MQQLQDHAEAAKDDAARLKLKICRLGLCPKPVSCFLGFAKGAKALCQVEGAESWRSCTSLALIVFWMQRVLGS